MRLDIRAAVTIILTLLAPSGAKADFTAPFVVASGKDIGGGNVAIDAQGRCFFVWNAPAPSLQTQRAVRTVRCAPDGRLGPRHNFSGQGQYVAYGDEQVAIDSNGNALVVWSDHPGGSGPRVVRARARSAAGHFGPIQTLSNPQISARSPQVAFDNSGQALIVWLLDANIHRVQARSRSPSGVLGPLQTLSAPTHDVREPVVAVAPNGRAIVAWPSVYDVHYAIEVIARSSGAALFPPAATTISLDQTYYVEIGIDADGDSVVGWDNGGSVYGRALSAAGVLGPVFTIAARTSAHSAGDGQVAVAANGKALLSWTTADRSTGFFAGLHARFRSAAGVLGAVITLPIPPGQPVGGMHSVLGADGRGLIVWTNQSQNRSRVEAITISSTGGFGSAEAVSAHTPPLHQVELSEPALNASGQALIVWNDLELGTDRAAVVAARGTVP